MRLRTRPHGFTLVELLIALVMLSVITLLLYSGLRLGSRAWEGVETVSERSTDLRLARNFIARSLRQALPIKLSVNGREQLVFSGKQDRLEFVAPLSAHVGIPGLYVLRLELESQAGGPPRLVLTRWLRHADILNGDSDSPAWEPLEDASVFAGQGQELDQDLAGGAYGRSLLMEQVGRFGLSYYGVARGERFAQWHQDWVEQDQLPHQVRLDLTRTDQTGNNPTGINQPASEPDWPAAIITLPGPGVAEPQF